MMKKIVLVIILLLIVYKFAFDDAEPDLDIAFYGKVVDQYEIPVKGAKVHHEFVGGYLQKSSGRGYNITDESGNFFLNGDGAYLNIEWISHPEIYYDIKTVNPNTNAKDSSIRNYDDFSNPDARKIFTAWRFKSLENVRKSSYWSHLKSDGRKYTIDISKGKLINERTTRRSKGGALMTEGANENGQLEISCIRPEMSDHLDFQDWSYTIAPIGGGIQQTNDTYLNVAPENNYLPSITIKRLKNSSNYLKNLENQRFYFKSVNDDNIYYGSLIIDFESYSGRAEEGDACIIRIKFKINLDETSNLAVDGKRRSY